MPEPSYDELARRLAAAEDTLRAIQAGGVDALVVATPEGPRIYTLEGAETFYRVLIEQMPVGAAAVEPDGRIRYANAAFAELLGVPLEATIGSRLARFVDPAAGRELERLLAGGAPADLVLGAREAELSVRTVGDVACVVAVDLTERRRHEERLRHVADHDALTGLLNRRSFEVAMDEHLARADRYGAEGALLILDIDHFKYINDARGHQAGDRVLVALAEALGGRLRDSDIIARLGGDEFAVLLPRGDADAAVLVGAQIVEAARSVRIAEVVGLRGLTVSVGIVAIEASGRSAGELMAQADLAMYDAKEAGRDRVSLYRPGAEGTGSETEARMTWLNRIKLALDTGTLMLHAQPIVDLRGGGVRQQELLVRLPAADGTPVSATVWFEIAERYDLATEIDLWVVTGAIKLLEEIPGGLNVNVSATSISRPDVLERLRSGLESTGADAARLTIEITETAAIYNIAAAARFVDELHALGCRLALDDFGAGFGSFYYLKHLPFDDIKIDGEFVRNSVNDERDRAIIRTMVDVATSMGRRTVAEAIEDAETLALMRAHGVDLAQGYHLGRPEPVPTASRAAAGANARAR